MEPSSTAPDDGTGLVGNLRQMIAALQAERQALATLDSDALFEAARTKDALCDALDAAGRTPREYDAAARELAKAARELNDVNRRVRNLLAAHVSSRLEALGVPRHAYTPTPSASAHAR